MSQIVNDYLRLGQDTGAGDSEALILGDDHEREVGQMSKASGELSNRYQKLEKEALDFGNNLDLNDPATAIKAVEHQAQMSTANLEFHFVLQSADDVRHTFRTLFQQQ